MKKRRCAKDALPCPCPCPCPSPWQSPLLAADLFAVIFGCLSVTTRLLQVERVCRHWRERSLQGAGWSCITFAAPNALESLRRLHGRLHGRLRVAHVLYAPSCVEVLTGLQSGPARQTVQQLCAHVRQASETNLWKQPVFAFPRLRQLELKHIAPALYGPRLLEAIALGCPLLDSLALEPDDGGQLLRAPPDTGAEFKPHQVAAALAQLPHLTELAVCNGWFMTNHALSELWRRCPDLPAQLLRLDLSMCAVDDGRLLEACTQLEALALSNLGQPLAYADHLPVSLTELTLGNTMVLGQGTVACLTRLCRLRELTCPICPELATSPVATALCAQLPALTWLDLVDYHDCLADGGLRALASLRQLSCLFLTSNLAHVTPAGLRSLQANAALELLEIADARHLSAAGWAALADLRQVRYLRIDNCPTVQDEHLLALARLPRLQRLDLYRACSMVTPDFEARWRHEWVRLQGQTPVPRVLRGEAKKENDP